MQNIARTIEKFAKEGRDKQDIAKNVEVLKQALAGLRKFVWCAKRKRKSKGKQCQKS